MSKKNTGLPTNETIITAIPELEKHIEEMNAGNVVYDNGRETITDKLSLIKDQLESMKKYGYPVINKVLKEKIGLEVSGQALRKFCQTPPPVGLGWEGGRCNKPEQLEDCDL